jgi:NTE family protein
LSLQHELQVIDLVNVIIQEGLLTDSLRIRSNIDMTEPIAVRFIRMSKQLGEGLDYPSKLSRQPDHINRLLADGEAQANAFLADLPAAERSPDWRPLEHAVRDEASAEMH